MEWLRRQVRPLNELLSAADRDTIVATHLRQTLKPLGLTQVAPRIWIDGSRAPAKRMFELIVLKGASMRARWGFSLDFVPHIVGGEVRWHRSDKTARLDVIVEPSEEVIPRASFLHGAAKLHDHLDRLLPCAVEKAKETWQRGDTERGMLDVVQEIREHRTNAWPFDMYTQLPLAYALLSARLGDLGSAERSGRQVSIERRSGPVL